MSEYVFTNKYDLVSYLYSKLDNPTNLKIQKAMYLLWAFYVGTYGSLEEDADNSDSYPDYLFEAAFEAWRYGPVDSEIYASIKGKKKFNIDSSVDKLLKESVAEDIKNDKQKFNNIVSFLNNLVNQIDKTDDFALVARTHEDSSWADVYREGIIHIKMTATAIKKEYAHKLNVR
ncbi:type II toxin-antitoxin system antitoxin SocA domain-containing protein [Leuconostoc gasicomitatum]|uniref:type II toxin-antitoxin system antitoxin SocA domain-containing protein n=1 Tax=Leuconostoc gasicomitatum TaxID=115778 RepID=UPI0007DEC7C2|nr:type II toxin-antitoxin system antitoxin SocA domain-containing protein [Leuconostoc gasicomitatum]CUW14750.1 hypothetical protein PB1E_1658 [Leuconostoc gasicomitatum]